MKLTKSQLKHIIKEELSKEGIGRAGRVAKEYGEGSFTDKGLGRRRAQEKRLVHQRLF